MYGSSLRRVTFRPRDSRIAAREAAAIPLPRDETTPPVTNTYLVIAGCSREKRIIPERSHLTQRPAGLIFAYCIASCAGFVLSRVPQRIKHALQRPRGFYRV